MRMQDRNGSFASSVQQYESRLSDLEEKILDLMNQRKYDTTESILSGKSLNIMKGSKRKSHLTPTFQDQTRKQVYLEGIKYIKRILGEQGDTISERDGEAPRGISDSTTLPEYWLKVVDTQSLKDEPLPDKREVVICDPNLRDLIQKTIPSYIDHTGKAVWQQKEVVLKANFITILFNHKELFGAATDPSDSSQPETRGRLSKLLEVVRNLCADDLIRAIDPPDSVQDFRVQWEHVWAIFKPGSLIVSAWNQAEDLQVLKVHHFNKKKDHVSVRAWIWDWDGKGLVRTLYEFRIEQYDGLKAPAELSCFPIEFWQTPPQDLKERRSRFVNYTYEQSCSERLLHYQGDIIGGYGEINRDLRYDLRYTLRLGDTFLESRRGNAKRLRLHKVGSPLDRGPACTTVNVTKDIFRSTKTLFLTPRTMFVEQAAAAGLGIWNQVRTSSVLVLCARTRKQGNGRTA